MKLTLTLFLQLFLARPVLSKGQDQDIPTAIKNHPVLEKIREHHTYSEQQLKDLALTLAKSQYIGQGHSDISKHPVTTKACRDQMSGKWAPDAKKLCQDHFMVPINGSESTKDGEKTVCIDQFEFPNIPCEYPVVWTRANEAHEICQSVGKRLCDADEWEQACAGFPRPQPYQFSDSGLDINQAHKAQRKHLNQSRKKVWSYGSKQNHSLCATNSQKSPGCDQAIQTTGKVWSSCGSNTYPSGYFPDCKSSGGVYDLHGNAAEHMNLPLQESQRTKAGGTGVVEMKGSWFIFSKYSAHPDDCFWRAPFWHGTRLDNPKSHHNYHLGFRCCKNI